MKDLKIIILFILSLIFTAVKTFPIPYDSLIAYLNNVDLFSGYNVVLKTMVSDEELPYIIPVKDSTGDWKFQKMTKRQRKDLMAALVKAHQQIISCINKLPEKYRRSYNKNKDKYTFRFIFDNIGFDHAILKQETYNEETGKQEVEFEVNIEFLKRYKEGNDSPYSMNNGKTHLSQTLGHEMMHFLFDKRSSDPKYECEVHCLEKTCHNPDYKIPTIRVLKFGKGGGSWKLAKCKAEICQDKFCDDMNNLDCDKRLNLTALNKPNDTADDNFSYASGTLYKEDIITFDNRYFINSDREFFSFSYYPDILNYNRYDFEDLHQLLDRDNELNYIDDYVHDNFSNKYKVLVISAGELRGCEDSEIIKVAFRRFLETGGNLLVFAQQYGSHFE